MNLLLGMLADPTQPFLEAPYYPAAPERFLVLPVLLVLPDLLE